MSVFRPSEKGPCQKNIHVSWLLQLISSGLGYIQDDAMKERRKNSRLCLYSLSLIPVKGQCLVHSVNESQH